MKGNGSDPMRAETTLGHANSWLCIAVTAHRPRRLYTRLPYPYSHTFHSQGVGQDYLWGPLAFRRIVRVNAFDWPATGACRWQLYRNQTPPPGQHLRRREQGQARQGT